VFGKVSKNIELLDKLEAIETLPGDKPKVDIVISDSGEIK
jgi:hypothetical protein